MRFALVDTFGSVIETGIKLTPFTPLPQDGWRWVVDPETPYDIELENRVPNPVTSTDQTISYTISPKSPKERLGVMVKRAEESVQALLDNTARSLGYDDIKSAATYADDSTVPKFNAEGTALRSWRSQVWATCYQELEAVKNGAPMPTMDELLAKLPAFSL